MRWNASSLGKGSFLNIRPSGRAPNVIRAAAHTDATTVAVLACQIPAATIAANATYNGTAFPSDVSDAQALPPGSRQARNSSTIANPKIDQNIRLLMRSGTVH